MKNFGFFCLHFTPPIGGAERSMQQYFEELSSFININVFCFLDESGKKFTRTNVLIKNGVKIIQSAESIEKCVLSYINSNQPDFIGTQLLWSDPVVSIAAKYGIPCYYFAHGLFEDICQLHLTDKCRYNSLINCEFGNECPNGMGLKRSLEKYSSCKKIFCNSTFTKSIFERFFPSLIKNNKLDLLYPFVDVNNFKFFEKTDRVIRNRILTVNSNFTKGRNIVFNLIQQMGNFEFIVVDTKEVDKSFFSGCSNVRLLGKSSREEMSKLYKESDVVIIPTFMDETFSLVACEAILSGTPVVGSRKGNLPNLIIPGITGFIVESCDIWDWNDAIYKAKDLIINESIVSSYKRSYDPKNGIKILKEEFGINEKANIESVNSNFNDMFKGFFGVNWN